MVEPGKQTHCPAEGIDTLQIQHKVPLSADNAQFEFSCSSIVTATVSYCAASSSVKQGEGKNSTQWVSLV